MHFQFVADSLIFKSLYPLRQPRLLYLLQHIRSHVSLLQSVRKPGECPFPRPILRLQPLPVQLCKGLQPKSVKQLARSSVLPVADYASPIWFPVVTQDTMQLPQQSQRIAAQAVIRAFRTVSLAITQVEADLVPFEQRLRNQAIVL
jgi:hypothetical protein